MSHERSNSQMGTISFGIENDLGVLRVGFNVNIGIAQYDGVKQKKFFFFSHAEQHLIIAVLGRPLVVINMT